MSTHISKLNIASGVVYQQLEVIPNSYLAEDGNWYINVPNGQSLPTPKLIEGVYPAESIVLESDVYYFKRRAEITTINSLQYTKYFADQTEADDWEKANLLDAEYINLEDDI